MIKYRINGWKELIERVEIDRETEHFVVLTQKWHSGKNRREAKGEYFNTWEEARTFLVEQTKRRLERSEEAVKREKELLQKFLDLKDPDANT